MKKAFYALLLLAELALDLMILSLLLNGTFYRALAAIVIIWAVLLVRLIPKLKKADDPAAKGNLYPRLALVMAVPVILFLILVIGFVIGFSMVN